MTGDQPDGFREINVIPLVQQIFSSCRVSGDGCEHPRELFRDLENQFVKVGSKRRVFPATSTPSHVQAPQVHCVSTEPKVPHGLVAGAGLRDDRCTVVASANMLSAGITQDALDAGCVCWVGLELDSHRRRCA